MNLATFIETHIEVILVEWEGFARSLGAVTTDMSVEDLRDHASTMLEVIVGDMRKTQTSEAQEAKGKGRGETSTSSAASDHGVGRHRDGFSLLQVTSEFRALRASVLRLWLPTVDRQDVQSIDDMIRFNEAVDQAISESILQFTDSATHARDVFLAMLGHDLRSPLQAIGMTTDYFERDEVETARRISSAKRIKRAVVAMTRMVNDLLDFSRMQLGGSIPVLQDSEDLVEICHRAIEEARTAHPGCGFRLDAPPELLGDFDADRLGQVLSNLLNNAFQYRARGTDVTMRVAVDPDGIAIEVHNFGIEIPEQSRKAIFDPLIQLKPNDGGIDRPRSSAGLGLFIARSIAEAHGGRLTVVSEPEAGTVFTVRLPR